MRVGEEGEEKERKKKKDGCIHQNAQNEDDARKNAIFLSTALLFRV